MYIEREAVVNRLLKVCMTDDLYGMGIQRGVDHALDVLKEAPAADVAPVVHGEWVRDEEKDMKHCSCCGYRVYFTHNYCPNCGAKMDGGSNAK